MPYVSQDRRVGLREPVDAIKITDEELCFAICAIAVADFEIDVKDVREVCEELFKRDERGEDITGDINFCICRMILVHTQVHVDPRYSKIHLINKSLRKAQIALSVREAYERYGVEEVDRATGVIDDVRLELYRRYAGPYEDLKAFGGTDVHGKVHVANGDIMD